MAQPTSKSGRREKWSTPHPDILALGRCLVGSCSRSNWRRHNSRSTQGLLRSWTTRVYWRHATTRGRWWCKWSSTAKEPSHSVRRCSARGMCRCRLVRIVHGRHNRYLGKRMSGIDCLRIPQSRRSCHRHNCHEPHSPPRQEPCTYQRSTRTWVRRTLGGRAEEAQAGGQGSECRAQGIATPRRIVQLLPRVTISKGRAG
jgi:hypothetical protein